MEPALSNARRIFAQLVQENVRVVLIGGLAAVLHGVPYVTNDIDLCYATDPDNCRRLVHALAPLTPRLRVQGLDDSAARSLPWRWDERTLRDGPNLTLETDAGPIDLLGSVLGVGDYAQVHSAAVAIDVFGFEIATLDLPGLIASKRAAGRTKDQLALPQIEATLHLRTMTDPNTAAQADAPE